jgi:hypothetical protein
MTNVVVQFYLLDRLFDGYFRLFGVDVTRYAMLSAPDRQRHVNPATLLFPKVSKCQYMRFGPSGSLELIDAMCILTVNVMNEKIFLLLWFWFVALIAFTIPTLAFHIALFSSATLRMRTTISRTKLQPPTQPSLVQAHVKSLLVGDWFLLHLLNQNLDPISFSRLLSSYAQNHTNRSTSGELI